MKISPSVWGILGDYFARVHFLLPYLCFLLLLQCPKLLLEGDNELPIHAALIHGCDKTVEVLYEKTLAAAQQDPRRLCDAKGRSLLSISVLAGHKKSIKLLLRVWSSAESKGFFIAKERKGQRFLKQTAICACCYVISANLVDNCLNCSELCTGTEI